MTRRQMVVAFYALVFLTILNRGPALSATQRDVPSNDVRDVRLFYEKLTPYGDWVHLDPHGWVWVPPALTPAWRPYTIGRWAYTEVGMTWVSALAWGWATFHYGRWTFNTQYGWVWVPGTVWAPAWVVWQVGNGWVGWAPLPSQAGWDPTHGLSAERLDLTDIEALRYVFVAAPLVLAAELHRHLVAPARSVTLLQQTRNTTSYVLVDDRVHNRSLSPNQVAQFVGHALPRYRLSEVDPTTPDLRSRMEGKSIMMFRPALTRPGPDSGELFPEPAPLPASPPPPPPAQTAPVPAQSAARRALDARLADEYAQLLADQEAERQQAPRNEYARAALRQQHERERRVFEVYAAQEREALDSRLRRKRGKVQFRLYYDEPDGQRPDLNQ